MNPEQLPAALKSLSAAQTFKEFTAIIYRQPALLEEVNISAVKSLAASARVRGDEQTALTLEMLASKLAALARGIRLEATEGIEIEPLTPESSGAWARPTREYCARRKEEVLNEAIEAARREDEKDVVELLLHYRDDNPELVYPLARKLFHALHSAGRDEEALTARLVGSDLRAGLVERFDSFPPERWAEVLNMGLLACHQAAALAQALGDRACEAFYALLRGNGYVKGRYLVEAEAVYERALALRRAMAEREPETFQPDVAATLHNLGVVRGDLRKLNEAEAAYEEALSMYQSLAARTRAYEANVALVLDGLGVVRRELGKPREAEAAHRDVLALRRALAERDCETYEEWDTAVTLNNLGIAQDELGKLNEAEATYAEALSIKRTLAEGRPGVYEPSIAATLNNLGAVRREMGKPYEAEAAYREALKIRRALAEQDPGAYEPDIASTLNNLGNVLGAQGKFAEAEAAYGEALNIARTRALPVERVKVLSNLGGLAILQERWGKAEQLLREAAEQVEGLRTEGHNLSRRRQVLRENVGVYERLVVCLLKQGEKSKANEALVVAEQGKSRAINDLLASREFRPRDEELARERDELLVKAQALEDSEDDLLTQLYNVANDEERNLFHRQIEPLRRERVRANEGLEKLARRIQQADPDFLPYAPPLSLGEIKQVARDAAAALLLFRVTRFGSFVFLVFPDGETDVVEVPAFTADALSEVFGRADDDKRLDGWGMVYGRREMGDRGQVGAWMGFMKGALNRLHQDLIEPVRQRLRDKRRHLNGSKRLVIVPNRGLAILPLHACWWEEGGEVRHLSDEYVCAYAPSLYILKRSMSNRRALTPQDKLLGMANPTRDLVFAEWECEEIGKVLGSDRCTLRRREAATKEGLFKAAPRHQLLHFSCHGLYKLGAPLQSSLTLADAALEMGEVLGRMELRHTWLTALSACETSLGDYREIADEQYGMPLSFLVAGTPTVWGALWEADDFSTALLMRTAYRNLRGGMDKPEALRAAQLELRDLTAKGIYETLEDEQAILEGEHAAWSELEDIKREYRFRITFDPAEKPFAHPYYWAALQCVGV